MKSISTLVLSTVLFSTSAAFGRLGETRAECAERYGAPTGSIETRLTKSEGKADVFQKGDFRIVVEYRGGKAWTISFQGRRITKDMAGRLLAKNAEGAGWRDEKFVGTVHWISRDQGLHAVYYDSPQYKLVVFDKAATEADYKPRVSITERLEAAEEAAIESGEDPDEVAEDGKADLLDGF